MKRKLLANSPAWMKWSDGRALTPAEWKKFRFVRKRTQLPGESLRTWFERVRAPIEKYEAAKSRIVEHRPGLLSRAWSWLTGKPTGTMLEMRPR